jgi:hypothetical protein
LTGRANRTVESQLFRSLDPDPELAEDGEEPFGRENHLAANQREQREFNFKFLIRVYSC